MWGNQKAQLNRVLWKSISSMYDHLARQQQATVHAITRTHVFYITLAWAKGEHKEEKPVNLDT